MLNIKELKKYYDGKKVLITGHTGFKGSYLCVLLKYLGAKVYGYSLKPEKRSLYELLTLGSYEVRPHDSLGANTKALLIDDEVFADIRDEKKLTTFIKKVKPNYIIHMAAQPLVLEGYENPKYTYDVNVMGTVTLMEAIRKYADSIKTKKDFSFPISILNVTTDKVYKNDDKSNYAFKERDKLCGRDPYSNSKSCSELVTYTYDKSFFQDKNIFRISTARAGNVIGGGDLNENRIIPDCYRSIKNKKQMQIRNPHSIRPYQFVLEPLILYLNILAMQFKNKKYEGNYNIGPDKKNCLETLALTKKFFLAWNNIVGANNKFAETNDKSVGNFAYETTKPAPHEANFLRLDNKQIKKTFDYKEIFNIDDTMKYTAKIYYDMLQKKNIYESIISIINNHEN